MCDKLPGPIPEGAKQTNCWKLAVIVMIIASVAQMINYLSVENWAGFFGEIFNLVVRLVIMMHVAYVQIQISDQEVNITMGPYQWCLFSWCCSNRLMKEEIVVVEAKDRQCCWDVWPRGYCCPVDWECCHKSYAAYFFPCCCDGINMCGLCDGDSPSHQMVQFNLTVSPWEFGPMCCKHCAPCPLDVACLWCYVYNRVAVSVVNREATIQQLQQAGYPLATAGATSPTATTATTAPGAV